MKNIFSPRARYQSLVTIKNVIGLGCLLLVSVACKKQPSSRPSYGWDAPSEADNPSVQTALADFPAEDSLESINTRNTRRIVGRTHFPFIVNKTFLNPQPVIEPTNLTEWRNPVGMEDEFRDSLVFVARRYLGTRYRSGGKTPRGFDCSGFTGYVFGRFGIKLPSCSALQAQIGEKVSLKEARKGDLVFFGYAGHSRRRKKGRGRHKRYYSARTWTRVNHAGIVISEAGEPLRIIHSASRKGVVVSAISGYWKRRLLFTRRVIDEKVSEKIMN